MGVLLHEATGERYTLHARTLVGRNPVCHVRLQDPRVSAEHATLSWDGSGWVLRDLGSSNGTWLDGQPMPSPISLTADSRFSFGHADDAWRLADLQGPVGFAEEVMGTARREAVQGLIVLPNDDEPEVSIYLDPQEQWVLESEAERRSLADQSVVPAGGTVWRVFLPATLAPTLRSGSRSSFTLHFRVSSDEEYVELDVIQDGHRYEIGGRSFNYLLLTLARDRLADHRHAEGEQGWVHQEDLARKLAISDITVYTQIHRARQRLAAAGVEQAAAVVERRSRTRQLRMGTIDIVEERL